jgi:hypothetical protein
MPDKTPRLLIQHRFKTHSACHEKVDLLLGSLPKSEYIIIAKVNRTYFEFNSCAFYLPHAVSLTGLDINAHQRNKNA